MRSLMLPVVGTFGGIATLKMDGLDPETDVIEDVCKQRETITSTKVPLNATLLELVDESDIQIDLEAAVKPTRCAGVGAYTPNAIPLA